MTINDLRAVRDMHNQIRGLEERIARLQSALESCAPKPLSRAPRSRSSPQDTGDSMTAEATLDRLMEMCAVVPMVGESWRRNRP